MSIFVNCPHCQGVVEVTKLNCKIFRHGTFKHSGRQIPPHATKAVCDTLVASNLINGCCKPFKLVKNDDDEFVAVVCDYI